MSEKSLAVSPLKTYTMQSLQGTLDAVPLGVRVSFGGFAQEKKSPVFAWLLVGVVHAALVASILFFQPQEIEKKEEPKPMLVSLLSNPAPEPELVPLVPPPPEKKQKKAVEKIVKKIEKKVLDPVPQVQEQVVEQPVTQASPQEVVSDTKTEKVVEVPQVIEKAAPQQPEPEPVVEPPRFGVAYLNNPAPNYPAMSRRQGEEGRVLLRVLVSMDGKAESVELEKSSGFDRLDQAALEVVKKWSFIPAKKGKEVLSAYVLVPVKFSLK